MAVQAALPPPKGPKLNSITLYTMLCLHFPGLIFKS